MTRTVLAARALLIAHVARACRRCLPASETLPRRRPAVSQRGPSVRSRRVPRELLDARQNLPEQTPCQVAFGELQGEVSGVSDEASARLEEPLLEACQGPALDGDRQNQPPLKRDQHRGPHLGTPQQAAGSGSRGGCRTPEGRGGGRRGAQELRIVAPQEFQAVALDYCLSGGIRIYTENLPAGLRGRDVRVPINHSTVTAMFWHGGQTHVVRAGGTEVLDIVLRVKLRVSGQPREQQIAARLQHEVGSSEVRLVG